MTRTELFQTVKALGIETPKPVQKMKSAELEALIKEAQDTEVGVAGTLKHRILELYGEGKDKKEILAQLTSENEPTDWASQLKCGKVRIGYIYTVIRNAK